VENIKSLKSKRALVTGAEGFIGSHLCRKLILHGARLSAIVYPGALTHRLSDLKGKIDIYPVDIIDKAKVKKILTRSRPVKLFHLAANVDHCHSGKNAGKIFTNNVIGTFNMMEAACSLKNLSSFINTGTCEEYGAQQAPFKETMPEDPVSPYSASKVCTTHLAGLFHRNFKLPVVTLRPFLTYGPAQDANMFIPSLVIACLKGKDFKMTSGTQTREFNYVADIVDGYLAAAVTPQAIGEVINLGNGREYKIAQVARLIKKLTKSKINLGIGALSFRKGEARHFYSSPLKARRILKWRSETSLENGLKAVIQWYQDNL